MLSTECKRQTHTEATQFRQMGCRRGDRGDLVGCRHLCEVQCWRGERYVSPDVEAAMSKQKSRTSQLAQALSTRGLEVLSLLTQGYGIHEIGERLGAGSALQLILITQQHGLDSTK